MNGDKRRAARCCQQESRTGVRNIAWHPVFLLFALTTGPNRNIAKEVPSPAVSRLSFVFRHECPEVDASGQDQSLTDISFAKLHAPRAFRRHFGPGNREA